MVVVGSPLRLLPRPWTYTPHLPRRVHPAIHFRHTVSPTHLNVSISPLSGWLSDSPSHQRRKDEESSQDDRLLVGDVQLLRDGDGRDTRSQQHSSRLGHERVSRQRVDHRGSFRLWGRLLGQGARGRGEGPECGSGCDGRWSRCGECRWESPCSHTECHCECASVYVCTWGLCTKGEW